MPEPKKKKTSLWNLVRKQRTSKCVLLLFLSLTPASCVQSGASRGRIDARVRDDVGEDLVEGTVVDRSTQGENVPPPEIDVPGCSSQPNPGRVSFRRLNTVEYDNTVRDLLGDATRPSQRFASYDDVDLEGGFDNNAKTLSVNSQVISDWMTAARDLAASAIQNPEIMTCAPEGAEDGAGCARRILAPLVRRAWRRTVSSEELEALVALATSSFQQGGTFAEGVGLSLRAVLLSPNFVFRVERIPSPDRNAPQALADFAIASRLSYFLWRSMPDDALLDAAEAGRLRDPEVLQSEVKRMVNDPKSRAMVGDLARQWLLGRETEIAAPDAELYPEFGETLRSSFLEETTLFLQDFVQNNLDVRDLLRTDFTFLNESLAEHYDLPGISGDEFRRVDLPEDGPRGGFLTQASVLLGTRTNSKRTSIENRGAWVLRRLLCEDLPPPPNDANERQEELLEALGSTPSKREISEVRSAQSSCGGCHQRFDPIGLALENYDLVGRWRNSLEDAPIDATGQLPALGTFDGARELSGLLRNDPRFGRCVAKTFLTFALGRNLRGKDDSCLVENVIQEAGEEDMGAADLILALVQSPAFLYQNGSPE